MIEVKQLKVKVDQKTILEDINFNVEANDFIVVLGANGAGKTTLIKAMMNVIDHVGETKLNGKDIKKFSRTEIARQVGVLAQHHGQEFNFIVHEVIALGRYCFQKGIFASLSEEDQYYIDQAIELCQISHLKDRYINNLSGGELQRVYLAMVLAQNPQVLILDEPSNHLDLKNQVHLFEILAKWVKQENKAIISVVHDLNFARVYASKVLLIKQSKQFKFGPVDELLTPQNLLDVFDFDVVTWMNQVLMKWGQ